MKPSDGAGNEEVFFKPQLGAGVPSDFSPDGHFLLMSLNNQLDLEVLSLEGERKSKLFLHSEFRKVAPRFSPDGHWISYNSPESVRIEIYVRPFPRPGGVWQISSGGGVSPVGGPMEKSCTTSRQTEH